MPTRRLLIADDDVLNAWFLQQSFENAGWEVVSVHNGQEAVDVWTAGAFDVVFMDGTMPGLDGFAASAEIRARERAAGRPRTHIIAVTGHEQDDERFRNADVDRVVTKPVRETTLLEIAEAVVAGRPE